MSQGVEQGKIRYLGLSNSAAWQLCKALWQQEGNGWARFASIQPSYNLADRAIEAEMIPLCRDQRLGIISYSPIAGGFLAGKYERDGPIPKGTRFDLAADWKDSYFHRRGFALIERLRDISKQEGAFPGGLGSGLGTHASRHHQYPHRRKEAGAHRPGLRGP